MFFVASIAFLATFGVRVLRYGPEASRPACAHLVMMGAFVLMGALQIAFFLFAYWTIASTASGALLVLVFLAILGVSGVLLCREGRALIPGRGDEKPA